MDIILTTDYTKVLFLDVDGVLNRHGLSTLTNLEPGKVDLLRQILERTNATICICSCWRIYPHLMKRLASTLRERGMRLRGVTQYLNRAADGSKILTARSRGTEIGLWLTAHPEVKRYAILDDSRDMGEHRHRLVRPDSFVGLQVCHVEETVKLLNE